MKELNLTPEEKLLVQKLIDKLEAHFEDNPECYYGMGQAIILLDEELK